jgi:hypothetical protein
MAVAQSVCFECGLKAKELVFLFFMKNIIFWDAAQCGSCTNRRFRNVCFNKTHTASHPRRQRSYDVICLPLFTDEDLSLLLRLWTNEQAKNGVFGMLRRVALVITDVSEELSASFITVTRIDELRITLAVTSNRGTLRRNTKVFFAACLGCWLQPALFLVHRFLLPWWWRR